MYNRQAKRAIVVLLAADVLAGADALAQTPLTLGEAMQRARNSSAAARALTDADSEAVERLRSSLQPGGGARPPDARPALRRPGPA